MAQWGVSVCHREMRILKLANQKQAPGLCPMGMSLVGRPVVSQEEHLARALGGETGCGGQRGSQGRRAPRGRAERSQGAPRYTRSSHLGPRPDPPGSCRTLGSHQAEASQVACTDRGPGAGRGVCAGASLRAHTVPQASRVPAALHCPLGEHGPAGLLAAASLSRCGCRVTWAPETQRGGSAKWRWLRAS